MGTSNFRSMDNFPLIVADDEYSKICPECHLNNDENATSCEECGADLSDVEAKYDEFLMETIAQDMKRFVDKIKSKISKNFFDVSLESGYYSGIQFYIDEKYDSDVILDEMTDEDCENDFNLTRKEAIEMYEDEMSFILKTLDKAKEELGLTKLGVVGRFSNGETIYHRA